MKTQQHRLMILIKLTQGLLDSGQNYFDFFCSRLFAKNLSHFKNLKNY
jgi:hypothetical protein